jgi:hypothetical protein
MLEFMSTKQFLKKAARGQEEVKVVRAVPAGRGRGAR